MHGKAVETICDRRARGAARLVVGAEHEVIDEQLRATLEEVRQRRAAVSGVEVVLLVDAHPRQVLPLTCDLIALAGQRLLGFEQLESCRQPLFAGTGLMRGHGLLLSSVVETCSKRD